MDAFDLVLVALAALAVLDLLVLLLPNRRNRRERYGGSVAYAVHVLTVAYFSVALLLLATGAGNAEPVWIVLIVLGAADVLIGASTRTRSRKTQRLREHS